MVVRLFVLSVLALAFCAQAALAAGSGQVAMTVTPAVGEGARQAKLWLPYPLSTENQDITDIRIQGNQDSAGVYRDPASGATYLAAVWNRVDKADKPRLVLSFRVDSRFGKLPPLKDGKGDIPAEVAREYLASDQWTPADQFREQAAAIVKGKRTILAKARAVYDWTVDNTFRDESVKGCGLGIPSRTLCEMKGGGKCADLSAVFVTMARAAGVPAREVFGLPLASPKSGDVTGSYHCWAEFYLPGTGWVRVDPADVRKMMLVDKLGEKSPEALKWREFFWGGDDLFRIALETGGRGVRFNPPQQAGPVGYFMYPYAEVDGVPQDFLDAKAFSYSVAFTAD